MLTINQLNLIKETFRTKFILEIDDINKIIYRVDEFSYGDTNIISRHIDIEYDYGEYFELYEEDEMYQIFVQYCEPVEIGNSELIIYEK